MIKRTIVLSNPVYISLANKQLKLNFAENEIKTIPIEDIGVLILENPQITISHAVLNALIENNAAIISCGLNHMPIGLIMPLDGANTQSQRFRYQIDASLPLKKQLWQQTVSAKIYNQAKLLSELGHPVENLHRWSNLVRSGDPDNYEGRAAAYYWQNIFKPELIFFRGRKGNPPNNLLNYGYSILRAIVARALVSSGLLPTLGIFHRNKYNAFCLADDIMEPYRPFVDKLVYDIVVSDKLDYNNLDLEIKSRLLSLAQMDVKFDDFTSPLLVGVSRTTASLARCIEGVSRKISFPVYN